MAHYDTASFGETTSADELAIVSAESSSGGVDIFRESHISQQFDLARNKARDIEEYETKIVEKYRDLDIYQKKKKNYGVKNFGCFQELNLTNK